MAISNLVLTQQIYSEEPNGAHAHYREPVPLTARGPHSRNKFLCKMMSDRVQIEARRSLWTHHK